MSRNQAKQKKLAVLKIVKENRETLFGCVQNNALKKQEKEDAWLEVLKKAQSLGLASASRPWNYARDHLFGLWKSRTLAKRNISRKTGTGSRRVVVFDEIDEEILDILGKDSLVVEGYELPEADVITSQPQQRLSPPQPSSKQELCGTKRNASDSLDSLKKEVLESELYINKLKILKLEKELGLPPSKLTLEFNMKIKSDSGLSLDSS